MVLVVACAIKAIGKLDFLLETTLSAVLVVRYVEFHSDLKMLCAASKCSSENFSVPGQMSAGLREDFNSAARGLTVALLDKMKDKNRAVLEAVHYTLDRFILVSPICCVLMTRC